MLSLGLGRHLEGVFCSMPVWVRAALWALVSACRGGEEESSGQAASRERFTSSFPTAEGSGDQHVVPGA